MDDVAALRRPRTPGAQHRAFFFKRYVRQPPVIARHFSAALPCSQKVSQASRFRVFADSFGRDGARFVADRARNKGRFLRDLFTFRGFVVGATLEGPLGVPEVQVLPLCRKENDRVLPVRPAQLEPS